MSAAGNNGDAVAIPQAHGGSLTPFRPGQSGNPSGLSRERRALYKAIEDNEVPKVLTMLAALYERGLDGDDAAARLWLDQVRGPVKARDDDAIEQAVEQKIGDMLSAARARRAAAAANVEIQNSESPES